MDLDSTTTTSALRLTDRSSGPELGGATTTTNYHRSPFTSYRSSLFGEHQSENDKYDDKFNQDKSYLPSTLSSSSKYTHTASAAAPEATASSKYNSSSLLDHHRHHHLPYHSDERERELGGGSGGMGTTTDYKYEFLGDNNVLVGDNSSRGISSSSANHIGGGGTSAGLFTTTTTSHSPDFLGLYNKSLYNDPLGSSSYSHLKRTPGVEPTPAQRSTTSPLTTAIAAAAATTTATTTTTTTTTTAAASAASATAAAKSLLDDVTRQIEDTIDSIEIPARGRCKVFMAKYGYDPFKQSPNDNPDAELALNAGDYIMVFDDIDEDGYFIGELMDGRRGYVPSNWLDRLTGEDLFEFQANVLYKQASSGVGGSHHQKGATFMMGAAGINQQLDASQLVDGGDSLTALELSAAAAANNNNSYPPEFYDAIIADTMNHSNFQHLLAPEDYHRMNDYVDLDDVDEVDDECLSDYERAEAEQMRRAVPPPQRLILERQLNKCILIAWLHPQATKGTIVSYQVYVDGVLKSTVPSGDRTKALLEGVDSNIPHRISVRAIDLHGRHSNDAGCTIVVGQKIPFAPSCVKASHITSDSALISWLPCNSNFHHVVAVNSVEVQTVRPGVYKHLAQGLSANTLYRVWVRAKPGKILPIDEKNPKKLESLTTYVDFKTMPKSLPDPPVNVQVEAGPQRRTLLVTWLPLTLNDYGGSSNGCAVTGYAVFAGHKKLADIDSPTGDHALLDIGDLESLHKKSVTVRTKSGENLSQDSMPCQIPDEYLKASNKSATGVASGGASHHLASQRQQVAGVSGQQHHNSSSFSHSPSRQRLLSQQHARQAHALQQQQQQQQQRAAQVAQRQQRTSRPLTRSLQNLGESDLDSRRSSIPAIEITRETSGSEIMMPTHHPHHAHHHHHHHNNNNSNHPQTTESFSEEEFESSMRLRGVGGMRGAKSGRGNHPAAGRFRARQSHSVDNNSDGNAHHSTAALQHQQLLANRQFHSQASLAAAAAAAAAASGRLPRGATPAGAANDVRYFVALFDYDPSTMSPNPNAAAEELAFKEGSIIKVYGSLGDDGFYKGELVDTGGGGGGVNSLSTNMIGSTNQPTGFVPCNVITEITEPSLLASLYERCGRPPAPLPQQQQHPSASMNAIAVHGPNSAAGTIGGGGGVPGRQNVMQPNQQQQQQQQVGLDHQQQLLQANTGGGGGGAVKRMVALYDYDPQENSPNADTESEIPFKTGDIIYVYGKMDTDGFYMGEVERTKQRGLVPSNFLREEPLVAGQKQPAGMQTALGPFMPGVGGGGAQLQGQLQGQVQMPLQGQQQFNQMQGQQGNFNNHHQQQQQQQQLRSQQQQLVGGANQQNMINRPNSLSLGGAQGPTNQQQMMMNNPQQQQQQQLAMQLQQQQQQQPQNQMNGISSMGLNQQMMPQQQQQQQQQRGMVMTGGNQFMAPGAGGNNMMLANQAQQQQPQQMQQQNPGVLSNLLSSSKQIIGAATTPRMPNQSGPFPGMQQQGMNQMMQPGQGMAPNTSNNAMLMNQQQQRMLDASSGANFGANPIQQQQQPPQQHSAMNAFNQVSGGGGVGGQQAGLMNATNLQHQQQPLAHNSFAMAGGHQQHQPQQQQQSAFNPMQGGAGNFNNRPGMTMAGGGVGGAMNQMGSEEPGLLNTVKNIFKL